MSKCAISDCPNTNVIARGWCKMHYSRWLRHGNPLTIKSRRNLRGSRPRHKHPAQLCLFAKRVPRPVLLADIDARLPPGQFSAISLIKLFPTLSKDQLQNRLGRLARHGKIRRIARGLYERVPGRVLSQAEVFSRLPNGTFEVRLLISAFPELTKVQLLDRVGRLARDGKLERIRQGHYRKPNDKPTPQGPADKADSTNYAGSSR